METAVSGSGARFPALHHKNFALLWSGLIVSNIGTWMQNVGTGWLIGLPSLGALGSGASAEWLGGIQGAPRAVLIGAALLGVVLVAVSPFFWNRRMSVHPRGEGVSEK